MSVVSRLSPKDKLALATFYDTPAHVALVKLLKLVKANAATQSLKSTNWDGVVYQQGTHSAIQTLQDTLKKIYEQKR